MQPLPPASSKGHQLLAGEKRDVRAQRGRNVVKCVRGKRAWGESLQRAQHGAGVRAPAAQATSNGNVLHKDDGKAARPARTQRECFGGTEREVFLLRS